MLRRIQQMEGEYGLRCANVFHAGDGNLHPLILYDANKPGELDRAEAFGADILRLCVEVGGVLTGEHGVGVEKRDLMGTMFTEIDLNQQQRLKCAFDSDGLLNPGKVFPQLCRCAELGRMHVRARRAALPRPAAVLTMARDELLAGDHPSPPPPQARPGRLGSQNDSPMTGVLADRDDPSFRALGRARDRRDRRLGGRRGPPLEIVAGGTKRALGRPMKTDARPRPVGARRASWPTSPPNLSLTARPGDAARGGRRRARRRQGRCWPSSRRTGAALLGSGGEPTLGGAIACNLAGPRRVRAGSARDYLLGFSAVNGFGEVWKAGGKVVKNVTGYDMCKLQAGAYGTLSVLTEVTLKMMPKPETACTLALHGLADEAAIAAMARR